MKKHVFFCLLWVVAFPVVNAQDVITLKTGTEIQAIVLEVGTTSIKYKKYGNENGPTYTETKAKIASIVYENGDEDVFEEQTRAAPQRPLQSQRQQPAQRQQPQQQQSQSRVLGGTAVRTASPELASWPNRKAFLGLTIGAAFLSDDLDVMGTGTQVCINFGYLFTEHIGLESSIFYTDFPLSAGGVKINDVTIGLAGAVTGPLLTTTVTPSGNIELDLRPGIGFGRGQATLGDESGSADKISFVFCVSGAARFNLSSRFALSGHVDYFNGKSEGLDLSSFGISVGANVRF